MHYAGSLIYYLQWHDTVVCLTVCNEVYYDSLIAYSASSNIEGNSAVEFDQM